jgi:hypothetical protein
VARAILGFLCTGVILALFYEPSVKSWGLVALCIAILLVCLATARNRWAVIGGIVVILASRLAIALGLDSLRYLRTLWH